MRADVIRLYPREHYVDLQRSITTNFGLFADGAIDAGVLNARLAEVTIADPFSVLLILPFGPRDVDRLTFLLTVGAAAGADHGWREDLTRAVHTAPVLAMPSADVLDRYAGALPSFLSAEQWLDQVIAIMATLRLEAGSAYDDFLLVNDIALQLSPWLGYEDYARTAAKGYVPPDKTEVDWGSGYTGGNSLFVDLFATDPARAKDAAQIAGRVETLPPRAQAQLHGWLLSANFEYYLGVGPIPPDLLPGIVRVAPSLAAQHHDLTERLMAEFDRAEQEMTAG